MSHELADLIRTQREQRHWTQRQLADRLGVHIRTITNWEGGAITPPPRQLNRIARLLDLQQLQRDDQPVPEELFDGGIEELEPILARLSRTRADLVFLQNEVTAITAELKSWTKRRARER